MRQTIANLEKELESVLTRYESEYEITTAEVCGILGVLAAQRHIRAILPTCPDMLREVLETPVEAVSGPPTGNIINLEREDD